MAKVSVIIKALNEEGNIDRAITSALRAVEPHGGEVILADSGSTDGTIERAMKFPITIVQLANPDERCCGIGPQLGYQYSLGEYVYILDGDMELDATFLAKGIELLDREHSVGGVGGLFREMRTDNLEFRARARRQHRQRLSQRSGAYTLNMGGLYRRDALNQVNYFSDRNLHGYEEYDVGARLRTKGWQLVRLEDHAADHYGYSMATFRLLRHRIRTRYVLSGGELLRAAIDNHYLKNVLLELPGIRIALGVWVYWATVILIFSLISSTRTALIFLLVALLLPPAAMMLRVRSLKLGFYSVLLWHVNAVGLIFGLARKRTLPTKRIESRILRTGSEGTVIVPGAVAPSTCGTPFSKSAS
jgi:glycosyltransferase involved in cell wall biosynthesis